MKKLFLAFALLTCFAVSALSQGAPPWTIQEVDGSPRVNSPTLIKVTNGTLSCTGKTCTITISGGGGGSPGGSSTQVQYNAAGSFGGISGFTSDGTNVTAGSANLRATRPRFITSIDDTNGNEVFGITATGSAVNEFTIANAATGSGPSISTSGSDTNIDMYLIPKGTGSIYFGSATTNSSARAGIGFIAKNAEKFWAQDSSNNNLAILDSANGLRFATGMLFGWTSSSTSASSPIVTGLARAADAVIRVTGSGTAAGNLIIGTSAGAIGTSGAGVLAFTLSTEPSTGPTDTTQLYYKDFAAGDGRLYLRNEASAAGSPVANLGDAQTFTGRITFSPGATIAGINVGSLAGDPSTPSNGDLWYDSSSNELTARINGANVALGSGGGSGANPTASVGLTAVNGVATTFMRSDAAPALDQAITPTWTGAHVWSLSSAAAISIGPNGNTNPAFRVITNVASAASGISITGRADGTAPTLQSLSRAQQAASIAGNGLEVRADDAVAGSSTAGAAAGGVLTLQSGAAARLTSGNANGGNILILPGAGIGTGVRGQVVISDNGAVLNDVMLRFNSSASNQGWTYYFGWAYMHSGASVFGFVNTEMRAASSTFFGWTNSSIGATIDAGLDRSAAQVVRLRGVSATTAATISTPALSPAQITSDQNNYAPGTALFQRWSSDASRNVTGLVSGQDGQLAEIWNVGSNNIVLVHESASSTAANRFTSSTGADLTISANKCAIGRYDATSARWRVYLCN